MNILHNDNFVHENRENLKIWFCERCQSVHFRAGEVLLTFSPEEFQGLTQAVTEIYCDKFFGLPQKNQQLLISETAA